MKSTPGTWPESVLRMLRSRSAYEAKYEVGTYYVDDHVVSDSDAWWAARKAGTTTPEEHAQFNGPWQVALFEAFEKFGHEVDTITNDEYTVDRQAGSDARTGADLIWDQLDAMVGAKVDLAVDKGWSILVPQTTDESPIVIYLYRIR